ncbi:hypothetical protein FNF27_06880 [Cafeteria roenbergensis]|uniref:Cystatin domain-containing protein n=2 Tax=Cafeteria roenbergensis TaxID=33653 RepID=A0A5A8C1K4_CAFRO|nr:hypothetical protein FNF28_07750 [Cafeteria roenbergensis]KAA0146923.1 hypothetical protein FNF29_07727 [Cafeteria roenbergensis]KAA0158246.1 hypothetical protein FNF31_05480 [Cafeteria roenbergensis]KAA0169699.1 hypothetical protein FNF27_06880 [Cafeteria roenbergensis]|eukprot:KAA0146923.1 hypothetical protein FNF29_07727 [Cafeteria roenbergensis]
MRRAFTVFLLALCVATAMAGFGPATLGGKRRVDSQDEGALKAAAAAVDKLNQENHSLWRHVLVGIDRGTKQVVNGVIYDLQLAVAISPCRNPYTMADPSAAEPKGDPCEKNYRVAETQPMHARVLLRPQEADPYLVTFDQDMF